MTKYRNIGQKKKQAACFSPPAKTRYAILKARYTIAPSVSAIPPRGFSAGKCPTLRGQVCCCLYVARAQHIKGGKGEMLFLKA